MFLVPFSALAPPPTVAGPLTIVHARPRIVQDAINYDGATGNIHTVSSYCSDMSLLSYNSERDADNFVQKFGGRCYNSRNELYALPSDQPEFERHDKQDRMLQLAVGNLYPAPGLVESVLRSPSRQPSAILDLGTGSGAWAINMALKYPGSRVVGVDLVVNSSRPCPPNCRFEFDDLNLGLAHFHDQFDLVHSRAVVNGIKDFAGYVDDIVRCLRPGGIAIMAEGDWRPYQADKETPYQLAGLDKDGGSWFGRICSEAFELMSRRGSSIHEADEVDRGLQHPLLEDQQTATYFVPLGSWAIGNSLEETASLVEQGRLMAENAREFTTALSHLFENAGYNPEVVTHWMENLETSLQNNTTREYIKYRYTWGVKKAPEAQN